MNNPVEVRAQPSIAFSSPTAATLGPGGKAVGDAAVLAARLEVGVDRHPGRRWRRPGRTPGARGHGHTAGHEQRDRDRRQEHPLHSSPFPQSSAIILTRHQRTGMSMAGAPDPASLADRRCSVSSAATLTAQSAATPRPPFPLTNSCRRRARAGRRGSGRARLPPGTGDRDQGGVASARPGRGPPAIGRGRSTPSDRARPARPSRAPG